MPRLRPATASDAPAVARVHVQAWRETYRGIVPQAHLDALDAAERERLWRKVLPRADRVALVAEDEPGEVVGFVVGGPTREPDLPFDAELMALYLLRQAQGRGAGRALVRTLAEGLLARGHRGLVLWVLAANPSRGFYERLGGRVVARRADEVGGATLDEVAYGWDDLRALAA